MRIENDEWRSKYETYIRSPEWHKLKLNIINKRGDECEKCGKKGKLDLHHLTYKRLCSELPQDLMLLCRNCHLATHDLKHKRKKKKTVKGKVVPPQSDMLKMTTKLKRLYKSMARIDERQSRGYYYGSKVPFYNRQVIVKKIKAIETRMIKSNNYE